MFSVAAFYTNQIRFILVWRAYGLPVPHLIVYHALRTRIGRGLDLVSTGQSLALVSVSRKVGLGHDLVAV